MKDETITAIEGRIAAEFERFDARRHPEDFPALPDLPAGRYTDPQFFALEQEHIWSKNWLFAGHADELPEKGSFKLWRDAGLPIVLVRGLDGTIRGFYNTCRHRGGPLVREESGVAKSLLCKYHCWNYDLTGALQFVPDEHEFPALDKSARGLIPVKVEPWGNWIFANADPGARPLAECFGAAMADIADLLPETLRLVERHSFDIAANWKVAMDAFQEVYHLKHIHPQTVDMLLDHRGATMTLYPGGHSRMIVPMRRAALAAAPRGSGGGSRPPSPEHKITHETSRAYSLFPNLVTPTNEFEWPFLIFWPTGIRTCRMDVWWWGQPDDCDASSESWRDRIAGFDAILDEDTQNLAWIQESLETPGFKSVPLSYQERRIYNHHEQVDRTIGAGNLPESLAIPQVLAPFLADA